MNPSQSLRTLQNYKLSLVLFITWASYLVALNKFGLWAYVGVPHMEPLFLDFHAILSALECHSRGINVFESNPCDVLSRPHVYGRLWLKLGTLGVSAPHLFSIGLVTGTGLMLLVVFLVRPTTGGELAKSFLILFSSAVTLGIERANNDLIIFILLALSAFLFTMKDKVSYVLGLVLIYLSSLLKIYPSVLFGAVLFIARRSVRDFIFITGCTTALAGIWLATNLSEILLLKNIAPAPIDHYATGARAFLAYIGRPYPWVLTIPKEWLLIGFVSVIALSSITLAFFLKTVSVQQDRSKLNYVLFIFGLTILFFTYTVNSNYDYRWIFFVFLMPQLFNIQKSATNNRLASRLVTIGFILAAIIMWTEALRSTRVFGTFHINTFFNIGGSKFSIELLQQFLKELAAWVLFSVLFALAIKTFPKKSSTT
jgi:hypothetical protein